MKAATKKQGLHTPAKTTKPTKLQNLTKLMKQARELGAKLVEQKKLKPL